MISLKKKLQGTPLIDGLYVRFKGLYQIRLKDTHECMSAVGSYEDLVRCGKTLCERYGTIENLRKQLARCEYSPKPNEVEFIRISAEQDKYLDSDLYKRWVDDVKVYVSDRKTCERTKRVGIRLKKVDKGN